VGAAQPLTVIRERYRLDALIGEGGMASVWRAWDLTLQRPVAVKLLFAREAHTEEVLVDRFLREARIAAAVQHRNVIHIVDFGTTLDGQPFMVMELLEGETLAARLRRQKPLPVPDVVQIGHLTLRGLGAVHAAGIIHRDLKPENVYLKNEGGVVYPKILDFGISRTIDPSHGPRSARTTREGVIVGTPEYMSPEQARGVKQIDYRTDIYSMGVVLYESLTGRLPYISENVGDLIIKIVTGSAPPVHELEPTVPRAISDVIARAMARLPGDRFLDAGEMQEALLAASHKTVQAALPTLSNLPPDEPGASPFPVPSLNLRPGRTLPRTQAMRILGPPPPAAANVQTLPPAAAIVTLPPKTPPPHFGLIEASPRRAFDPAFETQYPDEEQRRSAELGAADRTAPGPDDTISLPAPSESNTSPAPAPAAQDEGDAALSTRPTDRAPSVRTPRWLRFDLSTWGTPRTRWLVGAGAVMVALAVVVWSTTRPSPNAQAAEHRVEPPKLARSVVDPTLNVSLKLHGLPPGAHVTVDGESTGDEIVLPRGEHSYEITVESLGKQPWHLTYEPRTDSVVEVAMVDATQPSATAKEPGQARPKKNNPPARPHSKLKPLRTPDF
jgi:serine/threonine-protein kinase